MARCHGVFQAFPVKYDQSVACFLHAREEDPQFRHALSLAKADAQGFLVVQQAQSLRNI